MEISNDEKKRSDSEKAIKAFLEGNFFDRITRSLKKEFQYYEKKHGGYWNRIGYISAIFSALLLLGILGGNVADTSLPKGNFTDQTLTYENFDVKASIKNMHHTSDLLIIQSEFLEYKITIFNKFPEDVYFWVDGWVNNSGETISRTGKTTLSIPMGQSDTITKQFPMKNPGVNNVNLKFAMYETINGGQFAGEIDLYGTQLKKTLFQIIL